MKSNGQQEPALAVARPTVNLEVLFADATGRQINTVMSVPAAKQLIEQLQGAIKNLDAVSDSEKKLPEKPPRSPKRKRGGPKL